MQPNVAIGALRRRLVTPTYFDRYYDKNVALLHFNGTNGSTTFTDQIGSTWTAAGNAQISTADSKFGGASGKFDGSAGTAITTPTSSSWDIGAADFTLEFWYRKIGAPQAFGRVFQTRNGDLYSAIALYINTGTSNDTLQLAMSANGTSANILTAVNVATLSSSAWNHVAVVRLNTTTIKVFVDGLQSFSTTIGSGAGYYNAADTVVIGGQTSGTSRSLNAYIDELRLKKGVALYKSNFPVPAGPFLDQ